MQKELKRRGAAVRKNRGLADILLTPEVGIIIPLIILVIFTAVSNPKFIYMANISSILRYTAFIGVLAIGQAVVIMSGEIDLSVGANAGFSGIIFGLMVARLGLSPIPAILAAIASGMLIGFVNGYLVAKFGLVNFITTLATMFICRGLQVTFSDGRPVFPFPEYYSDFAAERPLSLSWLFFIMLGILVVTEIIIRFTTIGRKVQAVGGNKEAALMGGINVSKVKWGAYIFSGAMAAVTGILWALDMAAANHDAGMGAEFRTITACAVGGISLAGGSGSILGVGLGVLLLQVLQNALQVLKAESNLQLVIIGLILIGAVTIDILRKNIKTKSA